MVNTATCASTNSIGMSTQQKYARLKSGFRVQVPNKHFSRATYHDIFFLFYFRILWPKALPSTLWRLCLCWGNESTPRTPLHGNLWCHGLVGWTWLCVSGCGWVRLCVCVFVCVRSWVCACLWGFIWVRLCVCVCVCVCMHACVCVRERERLCVGVGWDCVYVGIRLCECGGGGGGGGG